VKANVYLRVACQKDAPHIAALYNHYVANAWASPERDEVSDDDMAERILKIKNLNLPWIVAVDIGHNDLKVELFSPGKWAGRERILGFAFADTTDSAKGALRFTAQVEVYVHKDRRNQGIGKALLDRLLFTIEETPKMQTECPWLCEDQFKVAGNARSIHRLVMNVMYAPDVEKDRIRSLWVRAWLDRFGFKVCGEQDEVGCRFGNRYVQERPVSVLVR
jgi:L-amino acid N-acyltransferase YncA